MASERTPELVELLRRASELLGLELRVATVGRIVAYDAATQKADVQPLVKQSFLDEQGDRQVVSYPVVPAVPVQHPGGGGFRLHFPVKAGKTDGDLCALIFGDQSLDRWLSGDGSEVDPEIDHTHTLSDAMALLGVRPFGAPLAYAPTDRVTLGADAEGGPGVGVTKDEVNLGSMIPSELDNVGLASLIKTWFDELKDKHDNHTHSIKYKFTKATGTGVTDGGDFSISSSGTSSGDSEKTSQTVTDKGDVGSANVKAKKP